MTPPLISAAVSLPSLGCKPLAPSSETHEWEMRWHILREMHIKNTTRESANYIGDLCPLYLLQYWQIRDGYPYPLALMYYPASLCAPRTRALYRDCWPMCITFQINLWNENAWTTCDEYRYWVSNRVFEKELKYFVLGKSSSS